MYRKTRDSEDIGDCLEPSGDEDAWPPCGCRDCGWYTSTLRDGLIRLGPDLRKPAETEGFGTFSDTK